MSFEWRETTLGESLDINPFYSIRKGTLAKKISMADLEPFTRKITNYEVAEFNGGSKFKNGDTLVARITPCLENGKTAYVNILEKDEIGFGSTEFIVLRGKEGISDNKYVYYLSISPEFRNVAIKSMTGTSGRQRAQVDAISKWQFRLPPIKEQKEISALLSSLDDKIELNIAINKNLEEMAQALFKRWFVDFEFPNENGEPYKSSGGEFEESELGLIPKGWKVGRATDIFDVQSGGTPKTSTSEYWNGEIPFFTPKDCSNSLYVIETEKTITEDGLNNCNSKLFKTDTVFITARGTVGKVALAGRDMAMNQSCYALVAKSGYTQKYVFHLTQQLVNVLRKNASGAVFDAITVSTFQNLKTTLPDIELVRHFDGLVNGLYSLLLEKANETQTLQQLRDTLLPKLMSGEIRVPVEQDHSVPDLPMVAESSTIYQS
ncbi:restriction endonuclease subunit S [Paenibacillus sp. oral taxon 786]|uniref:restriction endonuclease subunit S n=1 Tax=Paenibacillus sp. oral taxon 786 TaxID=652715 RepID=UPI000682E660|nr:restriction endonuclease subunit S [Paenibacillus sp. oral taxon 786]